jgi:hypothetical protein
VAEGQVDASANILSRSVSFACRAEELIPIRPISAILGGEEFFPLTSQRHFLQFDCRGNTSANLFLKIER